MSQIELFLKGVISIVFEREFYCTRDHDHQVSCNGFIFLRTSAPTMIDLTEK